MCGNGHIKSRYDLELYLATTGLRNRKRIVLYGLSLNRCYLSDNLAY